MAIKLTAENIQPGEVEIYENLSDEEKIAFNKLDDIDRLAARKLRRSYIEHWKNRQECKGKKAPPDYWDTPPGSARITDHETGEIIAIL